MSHHNHHHGPRLPSGVNRRPAAAPLAPGQAPAPTRQQNPPRPQPKFSAPSGFHHGVPVPAELKGLSYAEEALIAIIQPAMASRILKMGTMSIKGHVSFFDRTSCVDDLASRLPRLPASVIVLELRKQVGSRPQSHVFREFKCRRRKVQDALEWCCRHSPAYSDVHIDRERLADLPVDGQLAVSVLEVEPGVERAQDPDVDLGPAPQQMQSDDVPAPSRHVRVGDVVAVRPPGSSASDGAFRPAIVSTVFGVPVRASAHPDNSRFSVDFTDGLFPPSAVDVPLGDLRVDLESDHTGLVSGPYAPSAPLSHSAVLSLPPFQKPS